MWNKEKPLGYCRKRKSDKFKQKSERREKERMQGTKPFVRGLGREEKSKKKSIAMGKQRGDI